MAATAEYRREHRVRNPQTYSVELAANNARRRAQIRLTKQHPADFRQLLDEERAREGLPPIGTAKRGRPAAA